MSETWPILEYDDARARIDRRRAEGCVTVEMEAAALFAAAQFRGVPLGQLLYAGDDVGGDEWDPRGDQGDWEARGWDGRASTRERLFWLAAEACLQM